MEVQTSTKANTRGRINCKSKSDYRAAKNLMMHGLYFLCGMVICRGTLMGELAPFGASYTASVPKKHMPVSYTHLTLPTKA